MQVNTCCQTLNKQFNIIKNFLFQKMDFENSIAKFITFQIEQKTFYIPYNIVVYWSKTWANVLSQNEEDNIITLDDSVEEFKLLLSCIFLPCDIESLISNDLDKTKTILKLSDKYDMSRLFFIAKNILSRKFNPSLELYIVAEQFEDEYTMSKCLETILDNYEFYQKSSLWDQASDSLKTKIGLIIYKRYIYLMENIDTIYKMKESYELLNFKTSIKKIL